jgi:chromate reductase, NAD(P)H dehydrogenase (quinone)
MRPALWDNSDSAYSGSAIIRLHSQHLASPLMSVQVAVLVGSLRSESLSRKLALNIRERAKPRLACEVLEIGDLPLYNQDLDDSPPAPWQRLRTQVRAAQAVLFVTPEYNRSIPGVLKNAIDVASRPAGHNTFDGKPAAVISQTPYTLGAFGANHALRQCCVYLNMPLMQQPEAYISGSAALLGEDGKLTSADTIKFLDGFIAAFTAWIGKLTAVSSTPARKAAD